MPSSRRHFLIHSAILCLLTWSRRLLAAGVDAKEKEPDPLRSFPVYIDTLIPGDETPGGVALRVDKQIVAKAKNDDKYSYLLSRGCLWLDEQARQRGADGFTELQADDREAIVSAAEGSPTRSLARVFFDATRDDALYFYYSNPDSWPGLGFRGPPQPLGYKDYTRPPTDPT
jgi:hypothetical protein